MKNISVILFLLFAILLTGPGCKKNDENNPDEPLLAKDYTGRLHLLFSNTFPEFSDTASVPVDVDKEGKMTFGISGLTYSGVNDNGQSKIQREGELIISPNGFAFEDEGEIMFAVDENTMVTETFKVWVWDGSDWLLQVNETISETWKDGLAFSLQDAEISGSVVQVVNANGTVKWTLTLSPHIE